MEMTRNLFERTLELGEKIFGAKDYLDRLFHSIGFFMKNKATR